MSAARAYRKREAVTPRPPASLPLISKRTSAALHSCAGLPCWVDGRAARLYATERGIRASFAEAGTTRLTARGFAVGLASDRIRPISEEVYARWMKRLAGTSSASGAEAGA